MASVASLQHIYSCPRCGEPFVAPEHCDFVSADEIHNVWACERCGLTLETTFELHAAPAERFFNDRAGRVIAT